MKVAHGLIGAGYLAVIWFLSPFKIWQKLIISLSAYSIEFFIISRCYGLAILLAYLFAATLYYKPKMHYTPWIILGLLANTHLMAGALSFVLALHMLLNSKNKYTPKEIIICLSIYFLMALFSLYTMFPAGDMAPATPLIDAKFTDIFSYAIFALPTNTFVSHMENNSSIKLLMLTNMTFAILFQFRGDKRNPILFLTFIIIFCSIYSYGGYPFSERHYGIIYVALIIFLFLHISSGAKNYFIFSLLALSSISGINKIKDNTYHSYSDAENAADWIIENNIKNKPIVSIPDYIGTPVASLIKNKIYYPECSCYGTYIIWNKDRLDWLTKNGYFYWRDEKKLSEIIHYASIEIKSNDFYILSTENLLTKSKEISGISLTEIASMKSATITPAIYPEIYYIYHAVIKNVDQ